MMFDSAWRFGSDTDPPKWLVREFKRALRLMSKNKEAVHLFDGNNSVGWTFIIAICPNDRAEELSQTIGDAIAGEVIESK